MLQADPVADLLQGHIGTMEIAELPPAVQGSGIENDVVMNVRPISMRGYNEGVPAFGKCHGQLIADTICFLGGDLSGFEGLPDLIGNHIPPLITSCKLPVLPFGKQELFVTGHGIAFIGSDQISFFRLLRILRVIRPGLQTLRQCFPFIHMHCDQSGRRHSLTALPL